MGLYSYTNDSASSSSYSSNSSSQFPYQYHRQEIRTFKRPPCYRSALHSVRKFPAKKAITKKLPIAPLPPVPPKVYNVDPVDFKDAVQKLTGAAKFQPTRLQEVAPPPLSLSPPHRPALENCCGALSPLGFSLSPSSLAWCSANLFSPGTLASFELNAVL